MRGGAIRKYLMKKKMLAPRVRCTTKLHMVNSVDMIIKDGGEGIISSFPTLLFSCPPSFPLLPLPLSLAPSSPSYFLLIYGYSQVLLCASQSPFMSMGVQIISGK